MLGKKRAPTWDTSNKCIHNRIKTSIANFFWIAIYIKSYFNNRKCPKNRKESDKIADLFKNNLNLDLSVDTFS